MKNLVARTLVAPLFIVISAMLAACGGGAPEPQRYSALCETETTEVTIADSVLLSTVRAALSKPTGPLTCADMEAVTTLENRDAGISDLTGLQYATNLEDLDLSGNDVADLGPIADLVALSALNLNGNPVASFEPLRNLTNLEDLHLCCNETRITDVSPLEGLTKLNAINISGYELGDDVLWPLLAKFPDLRGLWIGGNDLQDMSPLQNYTNAFALELNNTVVGDISFLEDFDQLTWLDFNNAVIGDLAPIQGLTTLTHLDLTGTGQQDLTFLSGLPDLASLDLLDNAVRDLGPLVANTGIGAGDSVNLFWNPLDSEDPTVQADIAALQARGVQLELNLGEQTRYSHVEPAEAAPVTEVNGSFPEAAELYGSLTGAYRISFPEGSERIYTFEGPHMPFEIDAGGAFTVALSPPTEPNNTDTASCAFGGTTALGFSPFFDVPVTMSLTADPEISSFYVPEHQAYYQTYWYSEVAQRIQCATRTSGNPSNPSILDFDLLLEPGWNAVRLYRTDMANGQTYLTQRTGSLADEMGVLHLITR